MKLALIGDPVAHSRSPKIHNALLRDTDLDGSYVAVRVSKGKGAQAVRRMRDEGYTGINITTPLKEEALNACDVLDEDARLAQAVNTIFFGSRIYGANTDGIGARSALEAILGQPIALERIGILGTGATARAILAQLRETDAYTFVWGRDASRVAVVCERLEAAPWPRQTPEIVLSTLPPQAEIPAQLADDMRGADIVMDTNYGSRSTLERRLGREVVPGELMLEAQARASFDFWLAQSQLAIERFAQS